EHLRPVSLGRALLGPVGSRPDRWEPLGFSRYLERVIIGEHEHDTDGGTALTDTELSPARREIIRALDVSADFDVHAEIDRRIAFLAERLTTTGTTALVTGVSGGLDSLAAGRLCRIVVQHVLHH